MGDTRSGPADELLWGSPDASSAVSVLSAGAGDAELTGVDVAARALGGTLPTVRLQHVAVGGVDERVRAAARRRVLLDDAHVAAAVLAGQRGWVERAAGVDGVDLLLRRLQPGGQCIVEANEGH